MAELHICREILEYGIIEQKLKTQSLIGTNEQIIAGFYPIKVKKKQNYCLLTSHQFILATKSREASRKDFNFELIPLQNIKTTTLERQTDREQLIIGLVLLAVAIFFIFLLPFLKVVIGLPYFILSCLISLFGIFGSMINFLMFFKGQDMILLKGVEKDVKLQGQFILWKMRDIYFWKKIKGEQIFQSWIKDIPHLFNVLKDYFNSSFE